MQIVDFDFDDDVDDDDKTDGATFALTTTRQMTFNWRAARAGSFKDIFIIKLYFAHF